MLFYCRFQRTLINIQNNTIMFCKKKNIRVILFLTFLQVTDFSVSLSLFLLQYFWFQNPITIY